MVCTKMENLPGLSEQRGVMVMGRAFEVLEVFCGNLLEVNF